MMEEQLTLFDNTKIDKNIFAQNILNDLNKLDTIWKGTFYIEGIELEKWSHVSDPNKVLSIIYKSTLIEEYGADNNFTYWCGYKESEDELYKIFQKSETLSKYVDDEDLSISITPNMILLYFKKFERKY